MARQLKAKDIESLENTNPLPPWVGSLTYTGCGTTFTGLCL